jgi:hypothetical protein
MATIIKGTTKDGRNYYSPEGSNLKFSTREVAERHATQATDNMARFRAAVAADTPEQRAANIRAFFGIKG